MQNPGPHQKWLVTTYPKKSIDLAQNKVYLSPNDINRANAYMTSKYKSKPESARGLMGGNKYLLPSKKSQMS